MKHCYLLEKLPDGQFTTPSLSNRLVDASHIRDGFRVFRLPFRRIEFVLTNGTSRNWEDNNGKNYVIDAPGRYVIEHGIRRVDDANPGECYQMVFRPNDAFIQIEFRADLWNTCYCSYEKDGQGWTSGSGEKMTSVTKDTPGKYFEIVIEAKRAACAFNDGGEIWDSNLRKNYLIGCPGKYIVADGAVKYISPSDRDLEAASTSNAPGKEVEAVKPFAVPTGGRSAPQTTM